MIALSVFAVGKSKLINQQSPISQPLLASDDQDCRTEDPESPEETGPYNFADAKLHVQSCREHALRRLSPHRKGVSGSQNRPGSQGWYLPTSESK